MEWAAQHGLEGLTIGRLAEELRLSKSGLFAHFGSKEALQVEILRTASARFARRVTLPVMKAPPGEPRLRLLFERWGAWLRPPLSPAGCLFISAAAEYDDRPGRIRDHLHQLQSRWIAGIGRAAREAMELGHFRPDLDSDQYAFELFGIVLAWHHSVRMLETPAADSRAHRAFQRLQADARLASA